jgi:hypothetical protein
MAETYRAWINQPSSLQPDHKDNGKRCIVVNDNGERFVYIYFTEGPIHSRKIDRRSLSRCKI